MGRQKQLPSGMHDQATAMADEITINFSGRFGAFV